jgi:hypothetical protein
MCGFDLAAAVYIGSNTRPQVQFSQSFAMHNLILLPFTATQPEFLPPCGHSGDYHQLLLVQPALSTLLISMCR